MQVVERSEVVVVATKPPLVPKVLTEVNPVVTSDNLIISIAMGIPLINLEQVRNSFIVFRFFLSFFFPFHTFVRQQKNAHKMGES